MTFLQTIACGRIDDPAPARLPAEPVITHWKGEVYCREFPLHTARVREIRRQFEGAIVRVTQ